MKKLLLLAALTASATSQAQVTPKVLPEVPVNGKSYILVNKAQTATQYMSRTSWDGSLYFLGESDSNYATHAFTAISNEDGTWSFGLNTVSTDVDGNETTTTSYMAVPEGTANLNLNATEPASFTLIAKENNFYNIVLGEGNNSSARATANSSGSDTPTKDLRLHLNSGSQYFVATYFQGPWYPDCAGGINEIENEALGSVTFVANDSTSFNWGFVQVDNVPAYYQDLQAVAAINKFYSDYCSIDDYAEGFAKTYEAAAAIYNSADYNEDDVEAIKALIDIKVSFYNEIEKSIKINETEDAILAAASQSAKNTFDSATAVAEVESALNVLKNAEEAYLKGTGDVTSMGQNMSFEDLSAQDGATTSGVAGAPAGWNVYVNGKQITTADEAKSAGLSAWHGVNADSSGDIKDGSMSFGVWNGSIPEYEISQTITGLENGTYEITAGLMAGSNGNGSRLTTQRIFGNLNSTYYGAEDEYNTSALNSGEVFAFAGNEILTTDTEMLPVTVNAFVYDGTLTFGVRTDGNIAANNRSTSNSAGGDGWFKTDNFKIINKGYIPADGIAVYMHYAEGVAEYEGMAMSQTAQDKLASFEYADLSESSSLDEIVAAMTSAKELLATVEASAKAYEKLIAAIEQHYDYLDQYQQKAGSGEYSDAIMDAEEAYTDGTAETEADVDQIIENLNNALQECIQSDDITEGMDLTEYIVNPSFEDLSNQNGQSSSGVANAPKGWNMYVDGALCNTAAELNAAGVSNWCAINGGDNLDITNTQGEAVTVQYTDGEHLWGLWAGSVPVFELSQTIKGLPAGTYTLTADIIVQNDWAGMNLGTQRLFANDYVTMFGAETDYVQSTDADLFAQLPADIVAAKTIDEQTPEAELKHLNYADNYSQESYGASGAPYTTTVQFGLAELGDIKIGVRSSRHSAVDGALSSQASLGWIKIDNFRLTYDSIDVPAGAEVTDIKNVDNNVNGTVEFYSTSGVRLSAPQKGINIVKVPGKTAQKVFVK